MLGQPPSARGNVVTLGSGPNAVAAALPALLAALGLERPDETSLPVSLDTAPLAELTLRLSEPAMVERDGTHRATAMAALIYQPPNGAPARRSVQYRVTAPLGPIKAGELTWYLERYAIRPSEPFQRRAREVEAALPRWGQALWVVLQASPSTAEPLNAWQARHAAHDRSQRRLSVLVEERHLEGADETAQRQARQAATQWLALPWELLPVGQGMTYLRLHPALPQPCGAPCQRRSAALPVPPGQRPCGTWWIFCLSNGPKMSTSQHT